MFNIGGGEFLIIFLVALVVLGPTKLPEAARQFGKVLGEFRRISSGFQREMQDAMNDPVSKVTGEATPKTLKDVTSVAEPPPIEPPATPTAPGTPTSTNKPQSGPQTAADGDATDPPMHGDR
jgi:sec-independent protein translocase protein TatB